MGIDYGNGLVNVDHATGIRYGVIPMNDLVNCGEDLEPDYGEATCGYCGGEAIEIEASEEFDDVDFVGDLRCKDQDCEGFKGFDREEAFPEEPLGYTYDDEGYHIDGYPDGDCFVTKSPYYTLAPFCSPCAPGAVYLRDGSADGEAKGYCLGHEWFEGGKAPYPVYRVSDGEEVQA